MDKMNQRAAELGMKDTHFCNCNGLPAKGHVTSACDIALMSCQLLKHDLIRGTTGTWMDTIRDGEFSWPTQQADLLLRRCHRPENRLHLQRWVLYLRLSPPGRYGAGGGGPGQLHFRSGLTAPRPC